MAEETVDTAVAEEAAPTEEAQSVESTDEVQTADQKLYAGKYKSVDDLEKGYGEMQSLYNSRYKGFTGAPESGEYELTAADGIDDSALEYAKETPMYAKLKERAIKGGMSNEMFNGIVNDWLFSQNELAANNVAEEKAKLGENADARIQNLIDRLGTRFEGDQLNAIKDNLTNAAVFEAWEMLLDDQTNTVAPPEAQESNYDAESELNELYNAVDDRGRRKMLDPTYAAMVNKKWKEYYGD